MADQKNIWSLQLMKYLIVHKGYTQVRFIDPMNANVTDSDIWLANTFGTYTVVHITTNPQSMNLARKEQIFGQYESIMKVIGKEGKLLDICLDPAGGTIIEEKSVHLALYPNCEVPETVLSSFDSINTVVFNVDDPFEEQKRLENDIQQFNIEHNSPKKREKLDLSNLRERFSLTFLVAGGISIVTWVAVVLLSYIGKYSLTSAGIFFGAYYKAFVLIFNDWWRLLTGGFVHLNLWHIWCNMMSLYTVSRFVENRIGFKKTFAILLISVIFGNLAVFIGDDNIVAVGLSGGIYGLLATIVVIFWQEGYYKIPALRRSFMSTLYLNLIINFMPNVSFLGHLGGFVAGLFLSVILMENKNKSLQRNFMIVGVIMIFFLGYLASRTMFVNNVYFGTDIEVSNILKDLGLKELGNNVYSKAYSYYTGGV